MIGSHISVYGEVQGSGFRSWAKEQALKLQLTGWTRKASDGSIEIFVQGEESPLNEFISFCWDGPSFAHVDDPGGANKTRYPNFHGPSTAHRTRSR
jgi:acylphosphatase